jgi:type III secretion protein Q
MLSRPLIFPRMTSSEAQALATLATPGTGHLLTALPDQQSAHLRLTPLPPGEPVLQAQGTQRLHLEWAGGQLALDVAPWVMDRWLLMVLGVSELDALPQDFRASAQEHLLDWVLTTFAGAGRGPARLVASELAQSRPGQASHAVQLVLELSDGQALPALLHMDSLALMLLAAQAQAWAVPILPTDLDTLPVPLLLCAGQTTLSHAQLQQLSPAGLVFMAENFLGDGHSLLLRTPLGQARHWSVSARLDGEQLTLTSPPTFMNTHAAADTDEDATSMAQMPVQLSFDLGAKVVTLTQLRQLSEGQALQLDRPVQQGVTIRANGAVIGHGQLLDIDGRLGVLVSELHQPRAQAED